MKSLRYLMLAILVVVVSSCRDHKETIPDEISEILGLKIDRPLEVALASPQGTTTGAQDYQSITVVFNQPMKELSADSAPVTEPFRLEPKTEGVFRWKGAATVSFEPKEPLPYGTEFTVTVPAGISAPDKKKLEKDYTFKFTTPGPRIVRTAPSTGSRQLRSGEPVFLVFNQPVDPKAVQAKTRVTAPPSGVTLDIRNATPEELEKLNKGLNKDDAAAESRVAVVTPRGLSQDTSFAFVVEAGLQGLEGPVPSAKSELFEAVTLSPLKFTSKPQEKSTAPEDGIPFEFNNNVSAEALKKNVRFSPEVKIPTSNYDVEDVWNQQTLYLALEPNQVYNVTLSGELTDDYGQKLGRDVSFTWKTGNRDSLGHMPDGIAVLEANGPLTIPLELRNIEQITYRMVVLDRTQLVGLLKRENTDWLWGDKPLRLGRPFTVEKTIKPNGQTNQTYIHNLDLKEALKNKKYGFVYYQVEMKGQDGEVSNRRGLAQVTDLAVTGKFSPENSLLAATALHSGKPLGGVEASILDPQGRPVWRGETGTSGLAEAPGWNALLGEPEAGKYANPPPLRLSQEG